MPSTKILALAAFLIHISSSHQEFLFYYEKENGIKSQMVERMKSGPRAYVIPLLPFLYLF